MFERTMVENNWMDFIFPPSTFAYIFPDITKSLKHKYYNELLRLGLNTLITVTNCDDCYNESYDNEVEYDEYNPTWIRSVQKIEPYYQISLDIHIKMLNVFISIFGFSLRKSKKTHK